MGHAIIDVNNCQFNVKIVYNFDSSGTLAKQIKNGADCDVFISANEEKMDAVASYIISESRLDLL